MTFDSTFKPNRDGLAAPIAAAMDRVFYARRPLGLNVQWIRDDGQLDEWSLQDIARRDAFVAKLQRDGKSFAISH